MPANGDDTVGAIGAAPAALPESPAVRAPGSDWPRHLGEMVLVMLAGMMVLSMPVAAIEGALGYPDLGTTAPAAATLVMAAEMTFPMALWMAYRGHHGRAVLEMSAIMVAPALALAAVGTIGLLSPIALESAYHPAMLVAMLAYLLVRRDGAAGTP